VQRARAESRSGLLPDADFVKLFSNLPELMMLNEDLLRDFEERVAHWDTLPKIADVIVRKGPYLKLYTVYIRDFSAMNFHFEEMCTRYAKFGRLVREFEKLPRCQHLRLQHYMLKPVQRLPQYRLLLEDYLRHLDPHSPDFDDTAQALRIVSEAAEHANNTVKQGVSFLHFFTISSFLV
jgi:FYVE, RhoGEF and PH domain containing 5/6